MADRSLSCSHAGVMTKFIQALVLTALSLISATPSRAGEVLFEDLFGSPLPQQSQTEDFNVGIAERQQGPLAPSAYTMNGADWQTQISPDSSKMNVGLYTTDSWLGVSPSWNLSQEDGTYSITLEFLLPEENGALETMLAIGRAEPQPDEMESMRTQNDLRVVIDQDPSSPVRVYTKRGAAASFPVTFDDPVRRSITIKWTQAGGRISDLEVFVDQTKVEGNFADLHELAAPKIMIGGRGRPPESSTPFGAISLRRLEYSKE